MMPVIAWRDLGFVDDNFEFFIEYLELRKYFVFRVVDNIFVVREFGISCFVCLKKRRNFLVLKT